MSTARPNRRSDLATATVSAVLGSVALLALTGCSITPATADELTAVGTFSENLAATQALLGGDWQVRDDPYGRSCTLPGGEEGQSTPALRVSAIMNAPGAPTNAPAAAAVASAWTQWGYTVSQSVSHVSIGTVAEVQAQRGSGEYLIFRASDKALTLQGESGCEATP